MRSSALGASAICIAFVLSSSAAVRGDDATDPDVFSRPGGDVAHACPPTPRDHIKEDVHIAGVDAKKQPVKDWLMRKRRWVDAQRTTSRSRSGASTDRFHTIRCACCRARPIHRASSPNRAAPERSAIPVSVDPSTEK
jgi:hypothetical protein